MYNGEYQIALDDKGRFTIPSRFREAMRENKHQVWFMTRGFDGAITLYTEAEWKGIRDEAQKRPLMDPAMLNFRRLFLGSSAEASADPQGRMAIPASLRAFAGIEREVVLLGLGNYLEIWSKARWEAFTQDKDLEYKTTAASLFNSSMQQQEQVANLTEKGERENESR